MPIRRSKWISRYVDGELPPPRRAQMAREMETSEEARRMKADFETIGERLREGPVPEARPAGAVWADVRRGIRLARREPGPVSWVLGSRVQWVGATMVAVLVGLTIWSGIRSMSPSAPTSLGSTVAEVEWMETDVPGATTMLYQDEETGLTVIWMMEPNEGDQGHAET